MRSNLGTIGKVTKIEDEKYLYENKILITWIGNVANHSKNIIDLIEVGDYVGGCKVIEVREHTFTTTGEGGYRVHHKKCVRIKSIVTKEQFASMEYKIEEDK